MDNTDDLIKKLGDEHFADSKEAVEFFIDTLRDLTLSLYVRAEAAEALGELGDPRAVEPLITLLTFDHPYVLKHTIIALEKIGSTRAVEPLMAVLKSDHPAVRTNAARALGNIAEDTDIVEYLAGLTKNLDSTARKETYDSIIKICKKAPRDDFNFLCTRCFHRYVKHEVPFNKTITYYACRNCRSSSYFLKGIEKVVLLVDRTVEELYARAAGTLAVNWYKIKKPFDFDEIRVNEKDDFDVEELAMKLKNDMDDERRKNLKDIPFYLSPGLKLSPAKMNLLKDNFLIHEYSGS
jgi:hypothetical protein